MEGYGKRVLVVDDDHHARFRLGAILVRHGYNVVPACNGITALSELNKRHFDVVVTDDRMPQLSGMDFLKQVQARHPRLPVILASTDIHGYAFMHDSRPFACIRKPYQEAGLLRAVRLAAQTTLKSNGSLVTLH